MNDIIDMFIIGGGVNGCGVAADAAGRGLSVVLCEKDDLASGTSSASTKLIHGGLRYLEHYEFMLVRKALKEREVLLKNAPHIIYPMRFLLPYHKWLRPAWMIRLGLFFYDHMGGRKILPTSKLMRFKKHGMEGILKDHFTKAFEYSDCWVDDARLVVLNAKLAEDKGAEILVRNKCIKAERKGDHWQVEVEEVDTKKIKTYKARTLVNASGPWVDDVVTDVLHKKDEDFVRLVKGSHIIVKKIFDHDKAYIFQGKDERIIFAIPYEKDFTLIGTTDQDYKDDLDNVNIDDGETEYLCKMVNEYLKVPISSSDIVSDYAGVRPLYNDGASAAQEATRDYVLELKDDDGKLPLLNIIGGKITTYRVLAENVLDDLEDYLPEMKGEWTESHPLPGGDFDYHEYDNLEAKLANDFPFLSKPHAKRLMRSYGTNAWKILEGVSEVEGMGKDFGHTLFEREVEYLIEHEWARGAEDILWRRTKLGLHMNKDQQGALIHWFSTKAMI